MQEKSDTQLLREYAEQGHEIAFREIVSRHAGVVFASALRQAGSPDLAQDIAQSVFTDLARKAGALAGTLTGDASLLGWLYRGTRFAALNQLRDDRRRQARERHAMQHFDSASETAPEWERVQPVLDEAMEELSDKDREALLLRFFKDRDFRTIAAALGVSEDAAQKRVSRALERLHARLTSRGITTTTASLSVLLVANTISFAPAGVAATLSTAALAGAPLAITAIATATMTALQKAFLAATLLAAVGTGIYEAHQNSKLREQVQAFKREQAPLAKQVEQLINERDNAARQLAALRDDNERLNRNNAELPRLRGKVGLLQREIAARPQPQNASTNWKVGSPRRLEEMSDVGLATPEAALQTTIWASINSPQRMADLVYLPTVNATNAEDVERKRRGQVDFAQKMNWSAVPEVTIERIDYHQQKRFDLLKDKNGNISKPGGEFADLVEITINYPGQAESVADQLDPHPPIPSQWRFTRVGDQWLQVILGASPDNLPQSAATK